MNKSFVLLLLILIGVTDCLPNAVSPHSEATEQGSSRPFAAAVASATMPASTPNLDVNCIAISSERTVGDNEGTPVFLDHAQIIVLMGKNPQRIPKEFTGNNGTEDQSVSLDNRLLIYRQINTDNLVVVEWDGTVIQEFAAENSGSLPGGAWISNDYIAYLAKSDADSQKFQLFALNIRTRELHKLRSDFPAMDDQDRLNWGIDNPAIYFRTEKVANLVYDPSLNRVVYPKQGSYFTLYDIQNELELATLKLPAGGYDPVWSADGQFFSLKGRDPKTLAWEIFIVSRDGGLFTPLTNLAKLYPGASFGSFSWSPDSRHLAFWVKTSEDYSIDFSLFILDLATMKMDNLCTNGLGSYGSLSAARLDYNWDGHFKRAGKPVWSPDGKKLLIAQFDTKKNVAVDILIDLDNRIAYPIATDLEPIGWMSSSPK